MKSYFDCINEISAEELYKGLLTYGFFAEKLPPIFSAEDFFQYCENLQQPFSAKDHEYITFDVMRNINIPRSLGIPNPMAYQRMCATLRDNWRELKDYFYRQTYGENYKVSRLHIRKSKNSNVLFDMSYDNWKVDGDPKMDLLIGSRYAVHADISTCFPSIYTHALSWALVGKEKAKTNRYGGWYNEIDKACRLVRNGETHGLLIGPHSSNLLAEIILTAVDHKLRVKWNYVRHIDDYTCYVRTQEQAQQFISELVEELRSYDLRLNYKKTVVEELPIALTKDWKRQLNMYSLVASYGETSYKEASGFLDLAVKLMKENGMDAAILNYAIKTLSGQPLTDNAMKLCARQAMHLAVIYPYLLPLLDQYVFSPYNVVQEDIKKISDLIYMDGIKTANYEQICYSIFFALKYDFEITGISESDVLNSDNCLAKLFGWIYYSKHGTETIKSAFRKQAEQLFHDDMDRNWLFVYEVLTVGKLTGEWKSMKQAEVSFLSPECR